MKSQLRLINVKKAKKDLKQFAIYKECYCGSGKKFKFCCAIKEAK